MLFFRAPNDLVSSQNKMILTKDLGELIMIKEKDRSI